jgi:hypothetical protein
MIDRSRLLADLQKLLQRLEADLLERSESADVPEVGKALRAEFARAKEADRTAQNFEDWRTDAITQAAAAWVLSCVFVRFLEDNQWIDPPRIAGAGDRLQRARDEHELFFRAHPTQTDRDYLLALFDQLAARSVTRDLFGEHNPLRELPHWLSGDAAGELLRFFQKIEPDTGRLVHDFSDPDGDTRFLGDLYQDLSEAARKKFALLQTPAFVEQFILDRTLEPAIDHFGLVLPTADNAAEELTSEQLIRLIDPACGSGHFLLGAFHRILARWQRREPGTNIRVLVQRTLDSLHGVDVNPFAIAIARFRLLLAAMRASGVDRLTGAPHFRLHLACGDSLLHAPLRAGQKVLDFELVSGNAKGEDRECEHAYQAEDLPELKRILRGGRYHAVVANPPYITPKDRLLNDRYRKRFQSCHMKYSLAVPFFERIFQLAIADGFTGQITANSFMKREFGKKMIESYLPTIDLTHVIDTSGAYIPGHGTPTVILFGRQRPPVSSTLRTVLGIRGEPATPDDPARGLVWSAIVDQIDEAGSQSEFVSVGDSARSLFHKHPWSIGGGGASELKERLESEQPHKLGDFVDCIGFSAILGEDEAFTIASEAKSRKVVPSRCRRPLVEGDGVRDWSLSWSSEVLFPYDESIALLDEAFIHQLLWPIRSIMLARADFSKRTYAEIGRPYWEYHQIPTDRNRIPFSITFGEVATHNHFVLDRGGKIFKQTAPVIKLPREASEDDHLALLGLLNSSTACFWMKQVCFPKGGDHVGQEGARVRRTVWDERYAFNGTNLAKMPLPSARPLRTTQSIESCAIRYNEQLPDAVTRRETPSRGTLAEAKLQSLIAHANLVFAQEELDWECYHLYGLTESALTYAPGKPRRQANVRHKRQLAQSHHRSLRSNSASGRSRSCWLARWRRGRSRLLGSNVTARRRSPNSPRIGPTITESWSSVALR